MEIVVKSYLNIKTATRKYKSTDTCDTRVQEYRHLRHKSTRIQTLATRKYKSTDTCDTKVQEFRHLRHENTRVETLAIWKNKSTEMCDLKVQEYRHLRHEYTRVQTLLLLEYILFNMVNIQRLAYKKFYPSISLVMKKTKILQ